MTEIWRDIKGYENLYKVSNLGNIISLKTNKILKPNKGSNGYLLVHLYNNGIRSKHLLIHRLVAEAFLPNPNNYPQVNHKDENVSNNNVNNLEWCDSKYNNNYGTRNKRVSKAKSKSVSKYDLTGNYIATYKSLTEAANLNNLFKGYISNVALGKQKTAGGFIWKYEK